MIHHEEVSTLKDIYWIMFDKFRYNANKRKEIRLQEFETCELFTL